ncbi:MAG TPA: metallophosphoesterase, partial [Stenotrophomonas sp.]|nr:metallophosphoesterase [Stenotrophomonas sp.]
MLSVVGVLLALYVVWRVVWPLRVSLSVRGPLGLLVVALALHHRIVARFAGTMASPEIPKAAIAVLATGFTTLLLGALAVL